MRPTKLIVSAFGPYAEETIIEFDKLGTNGIYLITGDTGAGKTTIFDAISYALFDTPSGNARDTGMFRSKYAQPEAKTFVELFFDYGGKKYRIKRNPEYERPAKIGENRMVKEGASAELEMPDGNIKTKTSEIKEAIKDILGVDREQFAQIAMVAQGEFLKLLTGTTTERLEIFRKLFKTDKYKELKERISKDCKDLEREKNDARNSVKQYIAGIECSIDNVRYDEVKNAKNDKMPVEEVMSLIDKIIEDDEAEEKKKSDEIAELDKDLEAINKNIGAAKKIEEAKQSLAKVEDDIRNVEKEEARLGTQKNESGILQKESEEIAKQIAILKNDLKYYDDLEKKQNEKKRLDGQITNDEKELKKLEGAKDKIVDEINRLKEEKKSLDGIEKELNDTSKLYSDEEKNESDLSEIRNGLTNISNLEKELEKARKASSDANREYTDTQGKYAEANRLFLDAQAGILAEALREDLPCPVCGSKHHPNPASKPNSAPTQIELERLKGVADKASKEATSKVAEVQRISGSLGATVESTKTRAKNIIGECSIDDIKIKIQNMSETCAKKKEELKRKINDLNTKINRKKEIEDNLPTLDKELENNSTECETIKNKIAEIKGTLSKLNESLDELSKKLNYGTKAEAKEKIEKEESKKESNDKRIMDINNAINKCAEKKNKLAGQKAELERQLESAESINLVEEEEKASKINDKKKKINDTLDEIKGRIRINKVVVDNLKNQSKQLAALENKYKWMSALSDTVLGKLTGKDKIMLETYVQMTYFEKILRRANTRFMIMSGGQYEFERNKDVTTQGQGGLDLDIIDHYNGSRRSVNSLSGGEKFKASLSLALGLSDEIQASVGGIKLDTMYIDEGFGSLDEDSRTQAIRALTELSTEGQRLIGIISHVGELKNTIDKQLLVVKNGANGSKVKLVV